MILNIENSLGETICFFRICDYVNDNPQIKMYNNSNCSYADLDGNYLTDDDDLQLRIQIEDMNW